MCNNGPIQGHQQLFSWAGMGLFIIINSFTRQLSSWAWRGQACRQFLPLATSGSFAFTGSVFLYGKWWAHSRSWAVFLMGRMGLFVLIDSLITSNGLEWAYHRQWSKLPMSMNGPICAHEEYCWWAWRGPFMPMSEPVNKHKWAYSWPWIILPMNLNGPNIVCEESCWWSCMGPFLTMKDAANHLEWAYHH